MLQVDRDHKQILREFLQKAEAHYQHYMNNCVKVYGVTPSHSGWRVVMRKVGATCIKLFVSVAFVRLLL